MQKPGICATSKSCNDSGAEETRNVPISTPQSSSQAEEPLNWEIPSFNEPAVIRKVLTFGTAAKR